MKARKLSNAVYQNVLQSFIDFVLVFVCASYNLLFLIIRRIKKLFASVISLALRPYAELDPLISTWINYSAANMPPCADFRSNLCRGEQPSLLWSKNRRKSGSQIERERKKEKLLWRTIATTVRTERLRWHLGNRDVHQTSRTYAEPYLFLCLPLLYDFLLNREHAKSSWKQ